ncbi:hypothetical protein BPOR_0286g00120 [Botrytis porri]|uniref:Uncharacterized protein n=1 Tax=Botrytis porri TaxID=87229 RepID=A0A4Z1KQ90_9HELO|nr:hypothetical protein BPOR_0286g00120 [Botrytis porri]
MLQGISKHPRWCHSENAYLASIIMHTIDGKEERRRIESVIVRMTIEQAKHHIGGVAFAQDPWPIRTYTIGTIRQRRRRIFNTRKAADRRGVENSAKKHAKKTAQKLQQQIERFIVPSGDSIASYDFNIEMLLEWQQEVEEMMAPLKQKWAEEDRAKAAQYQSAVTAADEILGADFWTQSQEDADME